MFLPLEEFGEACLRLCEVVIWLLHNLDKAGFEVMHDITPNNALLLHNAGHFLGLHLIAWNPTKSETVETNLHNHVG